MKRDFRADVVLKAFLSRCEPERKGVLEKFLSDEKRNRLEEIHAPLEPEPFSNESVLDQVHWSWFLPTLKAYSEVESKLFLAVLNPHAAKSLAKALTLSINGKEMSEIGRSFLRKILLDSLIDPAQGLLSLHYLPASPLKKLSALSKKELIHLIEKLSLYDLASELRQIVETKILKKIYSLLSGEEQKFLKKIAQHKEPIVPGRLGLEKWDGSEESLRRLLHKRGLVRFGAALSGQDPDLIWMICHQLDIGRGMALHKLCSREKIQGVTEVIIKQIEEII